MKQIRYILAVTACYGTLTAMAQNETPTQLDSLRNTVESLTEVVNQVRKTQEDTYQSQRIEKTWSKSKPFTLSYGTQNLDDIDLGIKRKSDLSVSIKKMRTYYLHSKPIANFFKVGLDAVWMDIGYSRYQKGKGVNLSKGLGLGGVTDGNFADMDAYFDEAYNSAQDYNDNDFNIDLSAFNIGAHSIIYNMGVGPNLKFAPLFCKGNPKLDKLKASAYFHWLPGFMGYFSSGDDTEVCFGPLLRHFGFGLNISYGRVGIGVEHRLGNTKLNTLSVTDEEDEIDTSNEKHNYRIGTTYFYIGFSF